jgi:2-polyprenyl-3-methyl-5-hydroxy-6-metoxy-1,4-benzoquinol methylase
MDLPGFGSVIGQWDLRGRFDNYTGRVPLAGRTVVDVGTASGFLSFDAEKRGALVTGFDADDVSRCQYGPARTSPSTGSVRP